MVDSRIRIQNFIRLQNYKQWNEKALLLLTDDSADSKLLSENNVSERIIIDLLKYIKKLESRDV